jgi:tetratricopeptide (TPR) repeat protein
MVVALAVLATVVLLAWTRPRHSPWLTLLVAPLVPVLAALAMTQPVGLANRLAERHLYLSTAGLGLGFAALLASAEARSRTAYRIALGGGLAIIVVFSALTIARNRVWHDELTLWTETVQTSPSNPDAHFNLAVALRNAGDHTRSAEEFQAAWRLNPTMILDRFAAGVRSLQSGNAKAAIPDLLVTTIAAPHIVEAHYLLAVALHREGRLSEAAERYREVLRLAPGHSGAVAALRALPQ